MRFIILFLALYTPSLIWGQWIGISPQSYPVFFDDFHLFSNGSMYGVSEEVPYFFKLRDIEQPQRQKIEVIDLKGLRFKAIHCFDTLFCLALEEFSEEVYRTRDGGYNWENLGDIPMLGNAVEITPGFWVSGGANYSLDEGNTIRSFGGFSRFGRAGYNDTAAILIGPRNRLFTLNNRGQYQKHLDLDTISNLSNFYRAVFQTHNGYLLVSNDSLIALDPSFRKTDTTLFKVSTISYAKAFGDTLLIANSHTLWRSYDAGQTWQTDTLDQVASSFSYTQNSILLKDKIYFRERSGAAGIIPFFNLSTKEFGQTAGDIFNNHHIVQVGHDYYQDPILFMVQGFAPNSGLHNFIINSDGTLGDSIAVLNFIWDTHFADSLHGITIKRAFQKPGVNIYHSNDAGRSWQKFYLSDSMPGVSYLSNKPFSYSSDAGCLCFFENDTLYRIKRISNSQFSLLNRRKVDAGAGRFFLHSLYFNSCDSGMIVADNGIYHTEDGGLNFQLISGTDNHAYAKSIKLDTGGLGILSYSGVAVKKNGEDSLRWLSQNISLPGDLSNWYLTKYLNLISFDWRSDTLYYSSDYGHTVYGAPVVSHYIQSYTQINDSVIMLTAGRNTLTRLLVRDTLNIMIPADTSARMDLDLGESKTKTVSVFPNPASALIKVRWEVRQPVSIKLMDLQGRVVRNYEVKNKQSLEIRTHYLKAGYYLMQFEVGKEVYQRKILIMR